MDRGELNTMRNILRYDVNRAYIGNFTGAEIGGAFNLYRRSKKWDKPIVNTKVDTGYIDGVAICSAVWYEMSYNPKRFGTVSPFLYKGKEDIFRFCDYETVLPKDTPGYDVVCDVREKMRMYLHMNKRQNGQWYDVIDSSKGNTVVSFVSGCPDKIYKKLGLLRDIIRIVVSQNLKDVNIAAYRKEMKLVIDARHPNGVRAKKTPYCVDKILEEEKRKREEEQARLERLEDAEENALLTTDKRTYINVPMNQYMQAIEDLNIYSKMLDRSGR